MAGSVYLSPAQEFAHQQEEAGRYVSGILRDEYHLCASEDLTHCHAQDVRVDSRAVSEYGESLSVREAFALDEVQAEGADALA